MISVIEIPLDPARGINVGLRDILSELDGVGSQLHWKMSGLWVVGADAAALEERANRSALGAPIDWTELRQVAETLEQVIDGLFVGASSVDDLQKVGAIEDLSKAGVVAIEFHDSTICRVAVRERHDLVRQLQARWKDAALDG